MLLTLLLLSCAKDGADSADSCTELTSGSWSVTGSCFGMTMGVELSADVDGCSFTLDSWSMDHGSEPAGGALSGSSVTLTGDGWSECTGTAAEDGTLSGTCPDDCTWEMSPE